jgi:hypothetical protein
MNCQGFLLDAGLPIRWTTAWATGDVFVRPGLAAD